MSTRNAVALCYWTIMFLLYWAVVYDGPPLRLLFWFYVHRVSGHLAYRLGKINMHAELEYHRLKREVWT